MILYLCADLLWATKVKSTAEAMGLAARPVRTIEMLEARLADSPVRALIVDLEAGPVGLDMIRHVRGAAAGGPPIRIVAFGPHVEVDALRSAAEAGADQVMTRGAFNSKMPDVLTSAVAGASA